MTIANRNCEKFLNKVRKGNIVMTLYTSHYTSQSGGENARRFVDLADTSRGRFGVGGDTSMLIIAQSISDFERDDVFQHLLKTID